MAETQTTYGLLHKGKYHCTVYWMDMRFFTLICLFVKTENKQKEARVGPVKKDCIKRKTMKKETSHFYSEKSNSFQLTVLSE